MIKAFFSRKNDVSLLVFGIVGAAKYGFTLLCLAYLFLKGVYG